jgi:hypothetical protein
MRKGPASVGSARQEPEGAGPGYGDVMPMAEPVQGVASSLGPIPAAAFMVLLTSMLDASILEAGGNVLALQQSEQG